MDLSQFIVLFDCNALSQLPTVIQNAFDIDEQGLALKSNIAESVGKDSFFKYSTLSNYPQIDFPCKEFDLYVWLARLDEFLLEKILPSFPQEFIEKWEIQYQKQSGWYFESTNRPDNIDFVECWQHWLSRNTLTNREFALLLLDCDPIIYQSQNYRALELLYNQIKDEFPQTESKSILDWMTWAEDRNYLDVAPNELMDWFFAKRQNIIELEEVREHEAEKQANAPAPKTESRISINDKRIESLKRFIEYLHFKAEKHNLDSTNKVEIDFDPFNMKCTKAMLLDALKYWEKSIERTGKARVWNIKCLDDFWDLPERKGICDNINSSTQIDDNYFFPFRIKI